MKRKYDSRRTGSLRPHFGIVLVFIFLTEFCISKGVQWTVDCLQSFHPKYLLGNKKLKFESNIFLLPQLF